MLKLTSLGEYEFDASPSLRSRARRSRPQLPASHPARQESARRPHGGPGAEGGGDRSRLGEGLPGLLQADRQRAAVALRRRRIHVLHEETLKKLVSETN